MIMALKQMASPVKHGIVSTLFGLLMLVFSEFDFILRLVNFQYFILNLFFNLNLLLVIFFASLLHHL